MRLLGPAQPGNESEIMEGMESKDSCPFLHFVTCILLLFSSSKTETEPSSSAKGIKSLPSF